MLHDITNVQSLGGHRLRLRFDDGVEGIIDMATRLRFDGVFALLADPAYFSRVRVEPGLGTICWPNGADLDPVVLYSLVTGKPIPDYDAGAAAEEP
jgi:hypothetical protein